METKVVVFCPPQRSSKRRSDRVDWDELLAEVVDELLVVEFNGEVLVEFNSKLLRVVELVTEVTVSEKATAEDADGVKPRSSLARGAMRLPRRPLSACMTSFDVPPIKKEKFV